MDNAECREETHECSIVMWLQHPGLSGSAQCTADCTPALQYSSPSQRSVAGHVLVAYMRQVGIIVKLCYVFTFIIDN